MRLGSKEQEGQLPAGAILPNQTTVFYCALTLTALLFVVALYFALGNKPSRIVRSPKMLALACMMVFAVSVAASVRWFLSQGKPPFWVATRRVCSASINRAAVL
jgi:hypothetical protein